MADFINSSEKEKETAAEENPEIRTEENPDGLSREVSEPASENKTDAYDEIPEPVRKRPTTCAEENAKYQVTPEERLGDMEDFKAYTKSRSRSKVRRRKKMVLPVIVIFCAIMAAGALVLSNVVKNLTGNRVDNVDNIDAEMLASQGAKPTPNDGLQVPTPDPEEGDAQEPSIVVMSKDKAKGERYVFHVEDVSWTKAKELAEAAGGHLVTVSSPEELDEIVTLAMVNDCNFVWLGCHREDDKLIWENGEEIGFYQWGPGEPSKIDKGDNVNEDYLLLWKHNGQWEYNDSRNDPCEDYKDMYGGKIGYVVEFDDNGNK